MLGRVCNSNYLSISLSEVIEYGVWGWRMGGDGDNIKEWGAVVMTYLVPGGLCKVIIVNIYNHCA